MSASSACGVTRPTSIGVSIMPVTDDDYEDFGLDESQGAIVSMIDPHGPAGVFRQQGRDEVCRDDLSFFVDEYCPVGITIETVEPATAT